MIQINHEDELTIVNNILFLAQQSEKTQISQRNLLNKWFQDSVKCYFFESTASPLIIDQLQLSSSAEVRSLIHKQAGNNKPKYMEIIEKYFFYIKQCKKEELFISKLQQILLNPQDMTKQNQKKRSYNTCKTIRKQFICLLILKYFQLYGKQEFPSFYDLWNTCFPSEFQKKKKLSKYDNKNQSQIQKISLKGTLYESYYQRSFQNMLCCSTSMPSYNESETSNQEIITTLASGQKNDNLVISLVDQQDYFQINYNYELDAKKQPINNHIFEEDSYQEENMSQFLQFKKD
ncbi:hypothetical protein ABPG73_022964 [Tetrahymena malaccensis]